MAQWVRAISLEELPSGSAREVLCGERIVALFRQGEEVWALDGVCPHQGGPLGKGSFDGQVVTCPWHGWQFRVATGAHLVSPTIGQATFPVRLVEGVVFVDLDGPA